MRRTLFLIAVGLCTAARVLAYAHHPYSAYDLDREITITGEVVRVIYAEPHSFMHVRDRDADGRDIVWIAELRGASRLRADGVTDQTLKPGERFTVTGSPGRVAADRRMRVTSMVRARDGWMWSDS